ncbi:MAG TPA: hypothetical protein VFZ09_42690 [Archangium sp.]|uniref:hypothetical protein n=1 Tax=Archangium sp. TaxID=1872627 RepID=UPI002E310788|nr:hypothetical protein [Archangium sp.]HEX5752989.1 hypothetical protein [Archangium sp.]
MTVPRAAILSRRSLRSSSDEGEYSPYTQYFTLNGPGFEEWVEDRSGGRRQVELSFGAQSILHHELAHWIQSHGTSIGALLSSLRGLQADLLFRSAKRLSPQLWHFLIYRRFGKDDLPFIPVDKNGMVDDPLARTDEAFAAFRSVWWALQVTQRVFDDPSAFKKKHLPLAQELRHALSLLWSTRSRAVPDALFGSAIAGASSAEEECAIRELLFRTVSVRCLLEGFASVNQFLYYRLYRSIDDPDWLKQRVQLTIQSLSETQYGLALRSFTDLCPAAKASMSDGMASFCVLVDLALNPALDSALAELVGGGELTRCLSDIYPGARFERLCRAAGECSFISMNADWDVVLQYQEDLLKRAGLSVAEGAVGRSEQPRLKSINALSYKAETLGGFTLADVEAFWQSRATIGRKRYPTLFVLPSVQYLYGRDWLRELSNDSELNFLVQPPLWSDRKRHIYFGLEHSPSHCLIFWSIVATIAYDVICGTGRIDLSDYPEDTQHSGIAQDALGAVFRHLGLEVK